MKKYQKYIFIFIVILAFVYFYYNYSSFKLIFSIPWYIAAILLLLELLSIYILSLEFYFIMRVFNIRLPFKEYFGLTVCNSMFNYYLPARGGLVVRAIYLKKQYQFLYSHYSSLLAGSYLLSFNSIAAMGLLLSSLLYLNGFQEQQQFILIFAVMLFITFSGSLLVLFILKKGVKTRWPKANLFLDNMKEGLSYFKKNHLLVLYIVLVNFVFVIVLSIRLYWCFHSLGIEVNFFQILVIRALAIFSMVISLTPGNLGINEGIIGLCANLAGVPLSRALTAATLDRLVAIIMTFALGLVYSRLLLKDKTVADHVTSSDTEYFCR